MERVVAMELCFQSLPMTFADDIGRDNALWGSQKSWDSGYIVTRYGDR